jgi:hypothetical protein
LNFGTRFSGFTPKIEFCDIYGPGPDVKEQAGSTYIGTDALIYSACR